MGRFVLFTWHKALIGEILSYRLQQTAQKTVFLYQIRLIRYRMVTNQPDQGECSRIQKDSLLSFWF